MTANTPPTATVKHVDASHLDDLAPLFDQYRQFYGRPSDLATARRFLAQRLADGAAVIYLARLQGAAAGFTLVYPSFSSVRAQPIWILNDLYVAPDARRARVGAALLDRAERDAREAGITHLSLQTALDNHTAQSLYEKRGWVRDHEFCTYTLTLSDGR